MAQMALPEQMVQMAQMALPEQMAQIVLLQVLKETLAISVPLEQIVR
jgi:hypothetical protein